MTMISDQQRCDTASKILADRMARHHLFPSEIFDEYAWNMLLHLFVALSHSEVMSESRLILLVRAPFRVGQRWLYHLAKEGQVENRKSGDDVVLTNATIINLRIYLDGILT